MKAPELIKELGLLKISDKSNEKRRYGLYKCDCGAEFKTQLRNIRTGATKSCGCYHKRGLIERSTTHGLSKHRIYDVWVAMVYRCTVHTDINYKNYGGRGIGVCERWMEVSNFIEDMYPSFMEGLSIDRIDNDGNYEPSNCRWVTKEVQTRNTRRLRTNNTSGYRGVTLNKKSNKWVVHIGIKGKTKYLGKADTAKDAALIYDSYVKDNGLEHTTNYK
jgi:hypothetical protein